MGDIPAWAVWVVIAVAMLAVEATTMAFFTIYFGVAAAIVAALAVIGIGAPLQIIAFGVLSVGGLALTRPQLKRIAGMSSATVPSGVDAMRGKIGLVTKQIGELDSGLVKVGGEVWTARSYFEHEPIAVGTRVEVVEIKGVTAMVIAAPAGQLQEES
jgi:membrane protein implicated in regulation of membrane protease activity